jgi:pimeloyl-ACP methyl ester carboxylesterase
VATFVLVHGSRHGGWCWQRVARRLRRAGHDTHSPTLTGCGERGQLVDAVAIDLDTHIADVASLLFYEDLEDVILVGHSYAGMVITGVAECSPERIAHLVYLDALVPRAGESHLDLAGDMAAGLRAQIATEGGGTRLPASVATPQRYGVVEPRDVAWVGERLTDHPAASLEKPLRTAQRAYELPRTYVACLQSEMIPTQVAARARDDSGFAWVDLDVAHDCMITAPDVTADALLAIAGAGR